MFTVTNQNPQDEHIPQSKQKKREMDDYDEFGNYIGEAPAVEEEEDYEEEEEEEVHRHVESTTTNDHHSIVLFEDRALFPSANSVFGDDVEIVHSHAPTETKLQPILPRSELVVEKRLKPRPAGVLSPQEQFQDLLCSNPSLLRTVAVCGALQCGKTSICSLLHKLNSGGSLESPIEDERARKVSLKARSQSSVCQSFSQKSHFIQTVDVPGHANFLDQAECGLEICDSVVLVVDVVEGMQLGTDLHLMAIEHFALTSSVVLCINKLDRMIHELKLTVDEASKKIHYIVDQVERALKRKLNYTTELCFASAKHGWCIDLVTMAKASSSGNNAEANQVNKLASMIFGDMYFDSKQGKFSRTKRGGMRRAFDVFVLDPIYKIYSHVLGSDAQQAAKVLNLTLSKRELQLDAPALLKLCLKKSFPYTASQVLTELALAAPRVNWRESKHVAPPSEQDTDALLCHLIKFVHPTDDVKDEYLDAQEQNSFAFSKDVTFRVLARVYTGHVEVGQELFLFDSDASTTTALESSNVEAIKVTVTNIRLPLANTSRQISRASEGMIVLLSGVDSFITKSATLSNNSNSAAIFPPLRLFKHPACKAVVKVAMEPLVPSELPKMLAGLRALQRAYPAARVVVEETGEHVLFGTGELYLDCMMKDLRRYSGVEIKVCEPFAMLQEGVLEQSTIRSIAETANRKSTFSLIVCPLEPALVRDLDAHLLKYDTKLLPKKLKSEYGYDILASRSVWAFADDANAFTDDTLDTNLSAHRESIVQGFRWAAREGPLCEEQLRGCKFKLLDCSIGIGGAGQIAPTIRKLCHQSMFHSKPVLYESVFKFDAVSTHHGAIGLVTKILQQRRGGEVYQAAVPGTKLFRISGFVPVLDSFGLETELRLKTKGQVYCQFYFDKWTVVPGDVMDETVVLRPLEPSPPETLARDLIVKTRRRKGLPESFEATSQIDTQLLQEMLG